MPVFGQTFWTIKRHVARAAGVLEEEGTATSGSATTLVDTGRLIDATDARIKGIHIYIGNGAGQGRETRATAFTPGTDTVTIPSGTALDSTSEYMFTRISHTAILAAIRRALWAQGKYAKSYEDQSLMSGSPLVNATFYDGSGTFPNGWTATGTGGTFTQESTLAKHGRYSCSMVSDGTNACGVRQDISNIGLYRGLGVVLRGWVFTNTADRVNLTLDDGIDTTTGVKTIDTANRGWGTDALETPALTISNRASRLRVSCNITAGGAVTAYFSGLYLDGIDWREWAIPAGSPTAIETIWTESSQEGPFDDLLTRECYGVVEETTRRLSLNVTLPHGRILHIRGRTSWADHTVAGTDDDTTFDGDPEGLIAASAATLLETMSDGASDTQRRIENLRAVAAVHGFTGKAVRPPAGALLLQRQ